MDTREKIFQKALKFYNDEGIEYVGVRELAKALKISPGNLAYHFPKKEDLILEVAKRLTVTNTESFSEIDSDFSLYNFLKSFRQIFYNHLQYKCLFLSFVHLVRQYPEMATNYKLSAKARNDMFHTHVKRLIDEGYLKIDVEEVADNVAYINLIGRFWLSEAAINQHEGSDEEIINYYLKLIAGLFKGKTTAKGTKELKAYINELL